MHPAMHQQLRHRRSLQLLSGNQGCSLVVEPGLTGESILAVRSVVALRDVSYFRKEHGVCQCDSKRGSTGSSSDQGRM